MPDMSLENPLDTNHWLAVTFCARLAEVLEAMTGSRPAISVAGAPEELETSAPDEELLWWDQPLSISPEARVWIGCTNAGWSALGGRALKAAGIEDAEETDIRQTYLELLQQSLSGFSQALGAKLGREVNCIDGIESAATPEGQIIPIQVEFAETKALPIGIVLSGRLTSVFSEAAQQTQEPPAAASTAVAAPEANEPAAAAGSPSRQIELLLDVELPVSVSFGRAQLPLKDILKLTSGSIVELNRPVAEPVEVIVNNCVLARGEVVVVDGNYGVRINEVISRKERLRTLN